MNTVILIGRLGEEVKSHTFDNGDKTSSFSLATNENYKNGQGEKVEKTEWHNIVAYGGTAENCSKFITKGSLVSITGKLATRSYDKDGGKHYITEIVANKVEFLDSKGNNTADDEN